MRELHSDSSRGVSGLQVARRDAPIVGGDVGRKDVDDDDVGGNGRRRDAAAWEIRAIIPRGGRDEVVLSAEHTRGEASRVTSRVRGYADRRIASTTGDGRRVRGVCVMGDECEYEYEYANTNATARPPRTTAGEGDEEGARRASPRSPPASAPAEHGHGALRPLRRQRARLTRVEAPRGTRREVSRGARGASGDRFGLRLDVRLAKYSAPPPAFLFTTE